MPILCNPAAKGGTGKSLLVQALSEGLAMNGRSVLVVDADPQANVSRRLMAMWTGPEDPIPTLAEVMRVDQGPVAPGAAGAAVRPCGWDLNRYPFAAKIDVISSRLDLERREGEAFHLGAVERLKTALTGVADHYDWTLIDCRPSLGHLSQNALAASQYALFSVNAEYDAINAAVEAKEFIAGAAHALHNPGLRVLGVVTNAYRVATSLHPARFTDLINYFDESQIWEPRIPLAVGIADSCDRAEPVLANNRQVRTLFGMLADRLEVEHGKQAA